MIVAAQSLALFLEEDFTVWTRLKKARAVEHILSAGAEVRSALTTLYTIPAFARNVEGDVTAPVAALIGSSLDPIRSGLGPIVLHIAAAFLLNPARGIQPQEDRSAAMDYRLTARGLLRDLQTGKAFIAPLDKLDDIGITFTPALSSLLLNRKVQSSAGLRQPREGLFGAYRDPATGEAFTVDGDVP